MNPLVAIVGRPNVGKSRLFNRIISKRKSIVLDLAGTTRDTIYDTVEWNRIPFDIVDTGGLTDDKNNMHFKMNKRVETVVQEASIVIMVCDYKAGVLSYDHEIANWLRKTDKQVFLTVNKIDKPDEPSAVAEFHQLGFKDIFAISAEHGYGVDTVMDAITDYLKAHTDELQGTDDNTRKPLKLVFTGKPNAGKSSIINYIIGNEIMLVDDKPGTTRDPVELKVEINKIPMLLIDTAGLKKNKDGPAVETLSEMKAKDSIQRSDIVVLVIDAVQGVTGYDKKIINMIQDYGKGCVIAVNKWDIIPRQDRRIILNSIAEAFSFVDYIPVVPTSAVSGEGIKVLVSNVIKVLHDYEYRIPTAELNKFFRDVLSKHQPISSSGKIIKSYYLVQIAVRPPVFVIFTNNKTGIKENYNKFIMSRIREIFGFKGVPVKVLFRSKG
jgi:GTP-binding protein